MDPLSIVASVIAVGSLAAQTCDAFATLRSLCKTLPGRMHAVNNEVADIKVVLTHVAKVFKERATSPVAEAAQATIPQLLKQAHNKLHELKSIIERLTKSIDKTSAQLPPPFIAYASKKEQSRLVGLQEDIKTIKCSLNIIFGALNSRDMLRIQVELQALSTVTSKIPEEQSSMRDDVLTSLAYHHETLAEVIEQRISNVIEQRISKVGDMITAQSKQFQTNQINQVGPLYTRPPFPHCRRGSQKAGMSPTRSEGVGVRVNQFSSNCRLGCPCICHKQKKSHSSSLVNRILGQLFVGYAGLPVISPKCDNAACERPQAPSVNVEYWFPLGFCWSQIVRLQIGYRSNVGPRFNLTTLRGVPDTAQCVEFALNGDIEGLKGLFKHGLASPWDVSSTRGYTLARWALYGKHYQTVKFLVQAGADTDYRPISLYDNSPRNKASDIVLQGGLEKEDVETLRCLTEGNDWIEEQNFDQLHKIVCGLSLKYLEEEILARPENIDSIDALGRTPLLWASARGDSASVATLLSHGADPNILDNQLAPPVSYAADRGHAVCVRLLLEAGAEPDPILPNGYKAGSSLNCAARNATDPLVLKTLLDFGADIESSGVDGRTSLIHVARTDNTSFAMLLLEYGADLNATSTANQTPLTTAIINNSHNVLRLLLDRWAEYSACPHLKGPRLLQIAASYADIETLQILTQTDHFQLKYDKDFSMGDFVQRLQGRHDVSEELVEAFDELLDVINTEPRDVIDEDDRMEKGLWGWHGSQIGSRCGSRSESRCGSEKSKRSSRYVDFEEVAKIGTPDSDGYVFQDALDKLKLVERVTEINELDDDDGGEEDCCLILATA